MCFQIFPEAGLPLVESHYFVTGLGRWLRVSTNTSFEDLRVDSWNRTPVKGVCDHVVLQPQYCAHRHEAPWTLASCVSSVSCRQDQREALSQKIKVGTVEQGDQHLPHTNMNITPMHTEIIIGDNSGECGRFLRCYISCDNLTWNMIFF